MKLKKKDLSQREKTDAIQEISRDLLEVLVSLVLRLSAKRFKEAFIGLLQDTKAKVNLKKILNNEVQTLINLIHIKEGLVDEHSNVTKILE